MLPTTKTKASHNLSQKVIGIYGRAGIGKSTLASLFDGVVFAATEAGLAHLSVHKVNITSWDKPLREEDGVVSGGFLPFCAEIAKGEHQFKTICIDTIDKLIILCQDYICREKGIDDIGDYKKFGAYHLVTQELDRTLTKLSMMPYGLIIVSHSRQEEVETKTRKFNKYNLDIGGKNQNLILNMLQTLLFIDSEIVDKEEIGVIRTKPSLYWEAKDKDKALPENIKFPLSAPEKAYEIINNCFKKKEGSNG